eukprot:COSAG03_NODE_11439_length_593_cov_0.730769_2_plen_32_part_01
MSQTSLQQTFPNVSGRGDSAGKTLGSYFAAGD